MAVCYTRAVAAEAHLANSQQLAVSKQESAVQQSASRSRQSAASSFPLNFSTDFCVVYAQTCAQFPHAATPPPPPSAAPPACALSCHISLEFVFGQHCLGSVL